jgi:hypothetical protein
MGANFLETDIFSAQNHSGGQSKSAAVLAWCEAGEFFIESESFTVA